jgi:hypothetical protein
MLGKRGDSLGKAPTATMTLEKLTSEGTGKARLFVHFPPPTELARQLRLGARTSNDSIEVTSAPEQAHYLLVGRWQEGKLNMPGCYPM